MADRDDKKFPNPEFLKTRTLGSRHLPDIDYEDEVPTGVDHRSERPAPMGPPPKADPNDVYYLTGRQPRAQLPSFTDTAPGPGSLETPRADLPPVVPSPRPPEERRIPSNGRSPFAHSPVPPGMQAPTSDLPPVQAPPDFTPYSLPMPLVSRSVRSKVRGRKRKHVWKAVVPPPRYPRSEPLARIVPPSPQALLPGPKPVEDRLFNAFAVLFVGAVVTFLAGWSFLIVTNTRTAALSDFITEPNHPLPSFGSAAPSASREP